MAAILLVEDETMLRSAFQAALQDDGHDVLAVASAEEALERLKGQAADLALVDLRLPGKDGLELLEITREMYPSMLVVIMTAHGDINTAVRAMKLGAVDFLPKPIDLDAISIVTERSLKQRSMRLTWEHDKKRRTSKFGLHQIIGDCPRVQHAKDLVRRMCEIGATAGERPPTVLIRGETGTGKDLLARAFHYEGPRCEAPFVQINCAALPDALAESELFGHTAGAFTDAKSSKPGLFEVADGGTLFLDEIQALPLSVQAKLLTAIESGRVRAVGSSVDRSVNVHILAATNQSPEKLVQEEKFRADLYHRLRVIEIELPPLRERGKDIDTLASHFVRTHTTKFGMPAKQITAAARGIMRRYGWPGNVRELCNRLESAVLLSPDDIDEESLAELSALSAKRLCKSAQIHQQDGNGHSFDFTRGPIPLEGVERELLSLALDAAGQNVSRAADLLCVSRDTMRYRMEKYGLHAARSRSELRTNS